MSNATRQQLEQAARLYFGDLCRELDQPRNFASDTNSQELSWQIEQSEAQVAEYAERIAGNDFNTADFPHVSSGLEQHLGQAISEEDRVLALQLIARAKRQQLRLFVHQVTNPLLEFEADDALFEPREDTPLPVSGLGGLTRPDITIERAKVIYLEKLKQKKLGKSRIAETARVMGWMEEAFGASTSIAALNKSQFRSFRDDLLRLKRGLQGKPTSFKDRVSSDPEQWLHNETRSRYWRSVTGLTKILSSDYDIPDIARELEFDTGKRMPSRETEPFSLDEIESLLSLPIFSGAKSPKRLYDVGEYMGRRSHWWSGVLMLVYGMRGGEFSQLMATDFDFDAQIPHFKIQPGVMEDGRKKSHKDHLGVLSLPIPEELLQLGLRDFVELHQKRFRKKPKRLFHELSLGVDRAGGGASKFWVRQFERGGLHKPGRGTHVFRHTIGHHLAAQGFSEEQIARLVGHKSKTVTGRHYAKGDFLELKLQLIAQLPFMKDLVDKLGGPHDPKKHQ